MLNNLAQQPVPHSFWEPKLSPTPEALDAKKNEPDYTGSGKVTLNQMPIR